MTTTTGKTTDDERGLLPYPVIIAATKGEPQAMNIVVQHYAGYIAHLSMRKLRDERGNTGIVSAILFTIIGSSVMNVETPITA